MMRYNDRFYSTADMIVSPISFALWTFGMILGFVFTGNLIYFVGAIISTCVCLMFVKIISHFWSYDKGFYYEDNE